MDTPVSGQTLNSRADAAAPWGFIRSQIWSFAERELPWSTQCPRLPAGRQAGDPTGLGLKSAPPVAKMRWFPYTQISVTFLLLSSVVQYLISFVCG
jgi:hypothetical protein